MGKISRRQLLQAMGGSVFFLSPILSSLRAEAQSASIKRSLFYIATHGCNPSTWRPSDPGRNFRLSQSLTPLEPIRDKVIILGGINAIGDVLSAGHGEAMAAVLTGQRRYGQLQSGDPKPQYGQYDDPVGPSIDYALSQSQSIKGKTALDHIVMSFLNNPNKDTHSQTCSWRGFQQPIIPENSPQVAFDRLFGKLNITDIPMANLKERQKSVLDAVIADFNSLKPRLGKSETAKMSLHMEAIRDLERQVASVDPVVTNACIPPTRPPDNFKYYDQAGNGIDFLKLMDLQREIITMAFACDRTRVATIMLFGATSPVSAKFLGGNYNYKTSTGQEQFLHALSHRTYDQLKENDPNSLAKLTLLSKWYATEFTKYVQRFDSIKEGSGSLLDNSVIMWGNELGDANLHTTTHIPYVLAGGCGGYFDTGKYINYPVDTNQNIYHQRGKGNTGILTAIMHAMGETGVSRFGDTKYAIGALPELKKA